MSFHQPSAIFRSRQFQGNYCLLFFILAGLYFRPVAQEGTHVIIIQGLQERSDDGSFQRSIDLLLEGFSHLSQVRQMTVLRGIEAPGNPNASRWTELTYRNSDDLLEKLSGVLSIQAIANNLLILHGHGITPDQSIAGALRLRSTNGHSYLTGRDLAGAINASGKPTHLMAIQCFGEALVSAAMLNIEPGLSGIAISSTSAGQPSIVRDNTDQFIAGFLQGWYMLITDPNYLQTAEAFGNDAIGIILRDAGSFVDGKTMIKPFTMGTVPTSSLSAPAHPMLRVRTDRSQYVFSNVKDPLEGNCHVIGWAEKHPSWGIPQFPLRSEGCSEDYSITSFSYSDEPVTHEISLVADSDQQPRLIVNGREITNWEFEAERLPLIMDGSMSWLSMSIRPGPQASVFSPLGHISNLRYEYPEVMFDLESGGRQYQAAVRFLPNDDRQISLGGQTYLGSDYRRLALYDADGVRYGELAVFEDDRQLHGLLWLEIQQSTQSFDFKSEAIEDSLVLRTSLGDLVFYQLRPFDLLSSRWRINDRSGHLQPVELAVPSIDNSSIEWIPPVELHAGTRGGEKEIISGQKLRLSWAIRTDGFSSEELSRVAQIRILKFIGDDPDFQVIDLPAEARSYEDEDVEGGTRYRYHIMSASSPLWETDCSDYRFFPAYSMSQHLTFQKNNLPLIPIAAGGAALATGAVILATSGKEGEEDSPPIAICRDNQINVDENGQATLEIGDVDGGSTDDRGIIRRSVDREIFTCGDVGSQLVVLTVEDEAGQSASCTSTVSVRDNRTPVANCRNLQIDLNEQGVANLTPEMLDNGSTDNCEVSELAIDPTEVNCAHLGTVEVLLSVVDGSGQIGFCTALVEVRDPVIPSITCMEVEIAVGEDGFAEPEISDLVAGFSDNCDQDLTVSMDPQRISCSFGTSHQVTLTVTDKAGNSAQCLSAVTLKDETSPALECKPGIVQLENQNGAIDVQSLILQASDNCSNTVDFSVAPQSLVCSDTAVQEVRVTATDAAGNTAECLSRVRIVDRRGPVIQCRDVILEIDEQGNLELNAEDLIQSAQDNCSTELQYEADGEQLNCANLGQQVVQVKVSDQAGNETDCTSLVEVVDRTAPTLSCIDMTVYLDGEGSVQLRRDTLAGPGMDNCGAPIIDRTLRVFDCEDLGANQVTVTARDSSGNTGNCSATVVVRDTLPPLAVCTDIVVILGSGEQVEVTAAEVTEQMIDNCGIASATVEPSLFDGNDQGTQSVLVRLEDLSGNESACEAKVTIFSCDLISSVETRPADCGLTNGTARVILSRAGTYTFQWSNGQSGLTAQELGVGSYTIIVTDLANNSCREVAEFEIEEKGYEYLELISVDSGDCLSPARIQVIARSPGEGPLQITVDGPPGSSIFEVAIGDTLTFETSNAGDYTFTAWDAGIGERCNSVLTVEAPFNASALFLEANLSGSTLTGAITTDYPQNVPFALFLDGVQVANLETTIFSFQVTISGTAELYVMDSAGCTSPIVVIGEETGPSLLVYPGGDVPVPLIRDRSLTIPEHVGRSDLLLMGNWQTASLVIPWREFRQLRLRFGIMQGAGIVNRPDRYKEVARIGARMAGLEYRHAVDLKKKWWLDLSLTREAYRWAGFDPAHTPVHWRSDYVLAGLNRTFAIGSLLSIDLVLDLGRDIRGGNWYYMPSLRMLWREDLPR